MGKIIDLPELGDKERVFADYCMNIRSGFFFAVADAYKKWTDVGEEELFEMINGLS